MKCHGCGGKLAWDDGAFCIMCIKEAFSKTNDEQKRQTHIQPDHISLPVDFRSVASLRYLGSKLHENRENRSNSNGVQTAVNKPAQKEVSISVGISPERLANDVVISSLSHEDVLKFVLLIDDLMADMEFTVGLRDALNEAIFNEASAARRHDNPLQAS